MLKRRKSNQQEQMTVFVSGVFDILHYGHIDFLKKAKNLVGPSGKLVVAIHDDKSVRAHKGDNRPVNKAEYRLKVLQAIKYVDEVTIWNGWENVVELVKKIMPDYIAVSGEEYQKKSVRDFANEHNIKLAVFPKSYDVSTTQLIQKLQK